MFQFEHNGLSAAHKLGFASSPKDQFDKHMHPFYEVVYLLQGNVTFHVEEGCRKLNVGDAVFIKPGQYHFADVIREETYERYVFKIEEEELAPLLIKRIASYPSFFEDCRALLPLLKTLDEEKGDEEERHILILLRLEEFLLSLSKKEGAPINKSHSPLVQKILFYVEEHLHEPLSLKTIARRLNYSPSYIARSFQDEMRLPLISYFRAKKVMAANALMRHGYKAKEAALTMGFEDYSTFYRSYKRLFGKPPSQNE